MHIKLHPRLLVSFFSPKGPRACTPKVSLLRSHFPHTFDTC